MALITSPIAVSIFLAEGNAELGEPSVIAGAGGCPDRTGMLGMSRTIRPAADRAEHLRCFQRHLDNVLVQMKHRRLRWIVAECKDIHFVLL